MALKYSLLFHETSEQFAERDGATAPEYWGAWSKYIDLLAEEDVLVRGAGAGLQPPSMATTLRVEATGKLIHDGPVTETKEQIGGILIIQVANLDEALKWAEKAPCLPGGAVEVRPVLPDPGQ